MGDFAAGFDRKVSQKLLLLLLVAGRFWAILLATFCPLLFSKVARLKPLRPKGLRVFWPLSHFFSSLKYEKNIKNYISDEKKVANWPAREFWRVSGGYLRFWSRSLVEPSKFLFQNGWRCAILAMRHSFIYLLAYGENALAKGVFSLTRYARRLI